MAAHYLAIGFVLINIGNLLRCLGHYLGGTLPKIMAFGASIWTWVKRIAFVISLLSGVLCFMFRPQSGGVELETLSAIPTTHEYGTKLLEQIIIEAERLAVLETGPPDASDALLAVVVETQLITAAQHYATETSKLFVARESLSNYCIDLKALPASEWIAETSEFQSILSGMRAARKDCLEAAKVSKTAGSKLNEKARAYEIEAVTIRKLASSAAGMKIGVVSAQQLNSSVIDNIIANSASIQGNVGAIHGGVMAGQDVCMGEQLDKIEEARVYAAKTKREDTTGGARRARLEEWKAVWTCEVGRLSLHDQ